MKLTKLAVVAASITCASFLAISCNKTETKTVDPVNTQTIPNNQGDKQELTYTKQTRPVLLEVTSTGCPGCGSWGKPTFKKLVNDYGSKITPLAVHIKYGDPFITTESQAIADNRHGSRYTPQIWVAGENAVITSGGSIQLESEQNARDLMDKGIEVSQPAVAAAIKRGEGKLDVTYGLKFIDMPSDGDYYLACYLTEDGISYNQASSASNPTIHNQVLRASASGAFGNSFTSTELTDNEINWQHSFDVSGYVAENTYVTVILWRKSGDRFVPVNGFVVK